MMSPAAIPMKVLQAFLERERFLCERESDGALCVRAGRWEVRVVAHADRIAGSLRHASWSGEHDSLFESLYPRTGQVGLWARRHASNVVLALESLVQEAEPEPMLRVLVVDDEEILRAGIVRMLDAHLVDAVGDAREALDVLAQRRYDLILLDVMLPGMDGVTLRRELRRAGVQTPICFITADPEFIRAPGAPVLTKPFSARRLRAAVRAIARGPGDTWECLEPSSS